MSLDNNKNLIIPYGVETFIYKVLNNQTAITSDNPNYLTINNLKERLDRLTSNNLILGSSFNLNYNNQESFFDENFFQIRWKIEFIGNFLNAVLNTLDNSKNSSNSRSVIEETTNKNIRKQKINEVENINKIIQALPDP